MVIQFGSYKHKTGKKKSKFLLRSKFVEIILKTFSPSVIKSLVNQFVCDFLGSLFRFHPRLKIILEGTLRKLVEPTTKVTIIREFYFCVLIRVFILIFILFSI